MLCVIRTLFMCIKLSFAKYQAARCYLVLCATQTHTHILTHTHKFNTASSQVKHKFYSLLFRINLLLVPLAGSATIFRHTNIQTRTIFEWKCVPSRIQSHRNKFFLNSICLVLSDAYLSSNLSLCLTHPSLSLSLFRAISSILSYTIGSYFFHNFTLYS